MLVALVSLVFLCLVGQGSPKEVYVSPAGRDLSCGNVSTPCRLQQGVAMASTGDSLLLLPGEYLVDSPIMVRDKDLSFRPFPSMNEQERRSLHCAQQDGEDPVLLRFYNSSSVLIGLTLSNCSALSKPPLDGGALMASGSNLTFTRCEFLDNEGRGIHFVSGEARFEDCLFSNNSLSTTDFVRDKTTSVGDGMAGYFKGSNVAMHRCIFFRNSRISLTTTFRGGALYFNEGHLQIDECEFHNNSIWVINNRSEGGAIYLGNGLSVDVRDTLFAFNYVDSFVSTSQGGAISCNVTTSLLLHNVTFKENSAFRGSELYVITPSFYCHLCTALGAKIRAQHPPESMIALFEARPNNAVWVNISSSAFQNNGFQDLVLVDGAVNGSIADTTFTSPQNYPPFNFITIKGTLLASINRVTFNYSGILGSPVFISVEELPLHKMSDVTFESNGLYGYIAVHIDGPAFSGTISEYCSNCTFNGKPYRGFCPTRSFFQSTYPATIRSIRYVVCCVSSHSCILSDNLGPYWNGQVFGLDVVVENMFGDPLNSEQNISVAARTRATPVVGIVEAVPKLEAGVFCGEWTFPQLSLLNAPPSLPITIGIEALHTNATYPVSGTATFLSALACPPGYYPPNLYECQECDPGDYSLNGTGSRQCSSEEVGLRCINPPPNLQPDGGGVFVITNSFWPVDLDGMTRWDNPERLVRCPEPSRCKSISCSFTPGSLPSLLGTNPWNLTCGACSEVSENSVLDCNCEEGYTDRFCSRCICEDNLCYSRTSEGGYAFSLRPPPSPTLPVSHRS
jgi:hypothetical protein